MKSIALALLITAPCAVMAQQTQQEFTINGVISKVKLPATAHVVYLESGRMKSDSGTIQPGGSFTIKGKVPFPVKGYMIVTHNGEKLFSRPSPDQVGIYLENGNITFSTPDSMFRAKVGGTPLNNDQQEMTTMLAPFNQKEAVLNAAFKKDTSANGKAKNQQAFLDLTAAKVLAEETFIKKHNNSLVSLNLLRAAFSPEQVPEKAAELYEILGADIKASPAGQAYLSSIGKAQVLTVGSIAPEFTLKNTKDEDVSLSSFKGKYVLIDFWASWCGPCRLENPNVVKAYQKYKAKNFTILGVSLDGGENARKNWTDAISKDGLTWEQVSDLRGWGNYVVQLYHINAVPANFLLDPNGKIIGKNLRGKDLEAKLASLF